ncbi:hypothetical protein GCM10023084_56090 [Streptomyces lacrimifluminis]|uniref:Uncharacterized protein n=1 Tax=Streptomyces lacrimifluminis TaxID=1500077 RepID=A0A917KL31_9ACTN|nr:hypothetical protein GCM10012282_10660 [Streptomyces lacrimifluminis]
MRATNAWLGATGLAVLLAPGEAVPRLGLVGEAYFPPVTRITGALGDGLSDDTSGRPSATCFPAGRWGRRSR